MKKTLIISAIIVLVGIIIGFVVYPMFDQYIARNFGGTTTIKIPKNTEVISGSFKGDGGNVWIMTRDTITKEVVYREFSEMGLLEGKIYIKSE